MSELKRVDRRPKDCCNEPANLRREDVAPGRYIEHCVCGNKHYVMEVDPLTVGVSGMYIAEDDGVLNPHQIKLGPSKIIIAKVG